MYEFLVKDRWNKDESGMFIMSDDVGSTAFSGDLQDVLMEMEDTSWWFNYRAEIILHFLNTYFTRDRLTLDVGGGNGFSSSIAMKKGFCIGVIEPSLSACLHAGKRGIDAVFCGELREDTITDKSVDQMMLLDVLEHIEDDRAFVSLLERKLKPDGCILITVPACMCLWSSEDDVAGHYRRYNKEILCKILSEGGFQICYCSYFMSFLFLPVFFLRVLLERIGIRRKRNGMTMEERKSTYSSEMKASDGIVMTALGCLEKIEKSIITRNRHIPFGSSIVAVARKR